MLFIALIAGDSVICKINKSTPETRFYLTQKTGPSYRVSGVQENVKQPWNFPLVKYYKHTQARTTIKYNWALMLIVFYFAITFMDNIATTEEVFVSNVYVLNLGKTPAIHFPYCQCTYFLSTMRIDNCF